MQRSFLFYYLIRYERSNVISQRDKEIEAPDFQTAFNRFNAETAEEDILTVESCFSTDENGFYDEDTNLLEN